VAVAIKRVGIERVQNVPKRRVDLATQTRLEVDAGFGHAAAFSLRFLALFCRECRQKSIERLVIVVEPMKLTVASLDQARGPQAGALLLVREQDVPGREILLARVLGDGTNHERLDALSIGAGGDQQACAAHRCEGYRGEQFGVVIEAVLRIGIGPGEIEHEFAARMRLRIERHDPQRDTVCILEHEMPGRPTGAGHGAPGFFEREQELVPQERLRVTGQRIPALRLDGGDAGKKPRADRGLRHACAARRGFASSASSCSRYLSASSAAMQPVPADVMAWR
jgi:hypothetical protein